MVKSIYFSPGGWKAYYGEKMSSVLDIKYRTPKNFELGIETSLIGARLTLGEKTDLIF